MNSQFASVSRSSISTFILVEHNDWCITNYKFLLPCFGALFGLKINFLKSNVILTGASDEEACRVANFLNCNLGSFPFKYLRLPISPSKLCARYFIPSILKVGITVMPWGWGHYNSTAGKVYLINACLFFLPMFLMGFIGS